MAAALVLARLAMTRGATANTDGTATLGGRSALLGTDPNSIRDILTDTVRSPAISALFRGLLGFGADLLAHRLTGFSAGGTVLFAVVAASSSDISGPHTMRAALPEANASAYVGTSTGLDTPVAILSIPLWMALAEVPVG